MAELILDRKLEAELENMPASQMLAPLASWP